MKCDADGLYEVYFFVILKTRIAWREGNTMATSKEYQIFIQEQLAPVGDVSMRAMMGEYIIYYKDKVIGGLYDNRFLVKPVHAARHLMPGAPVEQPYSGAKEMLLVERLEDPVFLSELLSAVYAELPGPKKRKPKKSSGYDPID